MGDPQVSIVIVSYNSRHHLAPCIGSIPKAAAGLPVEVLVVDNDSADNSADFVRSRHPEAQVIALDENLGFSKANNIGAGMASGEHLLILNPDAELESGSLSTLVSLMRERPAAGVVAPRLVYPDGRDQGTARSFPTPAAALFGRRSPLTRMFPGNPWSKKFLIGKDRPADRPFPVDWVSGACMLVRRSLFEELGGFDEGFFMHFEDADLCHRAKAQGWQVWCEPRALARHEEGGSRRGWPPDQVRYFHEGAYRYYARNHLTGPRRLLRGPARAVLRVRAELVIGRDRLAALIRSEGRPTAGGGAA